MIAVYVLVGLIGAAIAVFALQNLDPVVIRFITWRIEGAPLAVVMLLSLVTGIVLAALVGALRRFKLRSRIRQLEQRIAQAQASAAPPAPITRPDPRPAAGPDLPAPR